MDDPAITPASHAQALAGLARLNRFSRGDAGLWRVLRDEAKAIAPRPLRILDLATGSGDLPIGIALRAKRAGLSFHISACDISPTSVAIAKRDAVRHGVAVDFYQHNVLGDPLPGDYDAVTVSLFLHHLSELDAIALLRIMAAKAERLVLVNDLSRGRMNVGLVTIATRVLSRSPVVHYDGPASVRAAFTPAEAKSLAETAGLTHASVRRQFPCRWLLSWRKPA